MTHAEICKEIIPYTFAGKDINVSSRISFWGGDNYNNVKNFLDRQESLIKVEEHEALCFYIHSGNINKGVIVLDDRDDFYVNVSITPEINEKIKDGLEKMLSIN